MKKKFLLLGLVGAILCSGINAFAATDTPCGHPSVTLNYGTKEVLQTCYYNSRCRLTVTYMVEYATCHSCFESFATGNTWIMNEYHSLNH